MRAAADHADRDDVERAVLGLCAAVGNGSPPGSLDSSLEDLGLDSLACADLAVAVQERFGVWLSETDLGAVRTPGEVVEAVLAHGTAPELSPVAEASPTGEGSATAASPTGEGSATAASPTGEGSATAAAPTRLRCSVLLPPGFGRLQGAGRRIVLPLLRWYARLEVTGQEHVPATGPVIVAPNHRSMLDIPVLVSVMPRQLYFMAKQELYKGPLLRLLWRELGGFPVRRQVSDLRALDAAATLLERGEAVGMYPEGTRNYTAEALLPFLRGPAWLALRAGVPIVPCGVRGTGSGAPFWRRRRVRVAFGPPIPVERVADRQARRRREQEVTDRLAQAVRDLL